ncbi:hypothetical protein HDU76_005590, partial [Blyttiomyces sp. JEL0837]
MSSRSPAPTALLTQNKENRVVAAPESPLQEIPLAQTRDTDHDHDFIPRAIYNDPIQELLLREEGASGRRQQGGHVKPLRKVNSFLPGSDDPRATRRSLSPSPTKDRFTEQQQPSSATNSRPGTPTPNVSHAPTPRPDERVVILSELGMDIISPIYRDALPPLAKAVLKNPSDTPIYHPSRHKALPPTFPRTVRAATWANAICAATPELVDRAELVCGEMVRKQYEIGRGLTLRYTREVGWNERPRIRRSGLSFRGRGVLEERVRYGEIEPLKRKIVSKLPLEVKKVVLGTAGDVPSIVTSQGGGNTPADTERRASYLKMVVGNVEFKSPLFSRGASISGPGGGEEQSVAGAGKLREGDLDISDENLEDSMEGVENVSQEIGKNDDRDDNMLGGTLSERAKANDVAKSFSSVITEDRIMVESRLSLEEKSSSATGDRKESMNENEREWLEQEKKALYNAWGRDDDEIEKEKEQEKQKEKMAIDVDLAPVAVPTAPTAFVAHHTLIQMQAQTATVEQDNQNRRSASSSLDDSVLPDWASNKGSDARQSIEIPMEVDKPSETNPWASSSASSAPSPQNMGSLDKLTEVSRQVEDEVIRPTIQPVVAPQIIPARDSTASYSQRQGNMDENEQDDDVIDEDRLSRLNLDTDTHSIAESTTDSVTSKKKKFGSFKAIKEMASKIKKSTSSLRSKHSTEQISEPASQRQKTQNSSMDSISPNSNAPSTVSIAPNSQVMTPTGDDSASIKSKSKSSLSLKSIKNALKGSTGNLRSSKSGSGSRSTSQENLQRKSVSTRSGLNEILEKEEVEVAKDELVVVVKAPMVLDEVKEKEAEPQEEIVVEVVPIKKAAKVEPSPQDVKPVEVPLVPVTVAKSEPVEPVEPISLAKKAPSIVAAAPAPVTVETPAVPAVANKSLNNVINKEVEISSTKASATCADALASVTGVAVDSKFGQSVELSKKPVSVTGGSQPMLTTKEDVAEIKAAPVTVVTKSEEKITSTIVTKVTERVSDSTSSVPGAVNLAKKSEIVIKSTEITATTSVTKASQNSLSTKEKDPSTSSPVSTGGIAAVTKSQPAQPSESVSPTPVAVAATPTPSAPKQTEVRVSVDELSTFAASIPKPKMSKFMNAMDMMTIEKKVASATSSENALNGKKAVASSQEVKTNNNDTQPVSKSKENVVEIKMETVAAAPTETITITLPAAPATIPEPVVHENATPAEKEKARFANRAAAAAVAASSESSSVQQDTTTSPVAKGGVSGVANLFKKKPSQLEVTDSPVATSGVPSSAPAASVSSKPSDDAPPTPEMLVAKVSLKGVKCDVKVENFELHCTEKNKPAKHFFPLELRRVLKTVQDGDEVTVHACVTRKKGMDGSKLKKLKFQFEGGAAKAKEWSDALSKMVYGVGAKDVNLTRSVLVLIDKFDSKQPTKMVETYMKPVFEVLGKPTEVKTVQFNEFSVANVLQSQDWSKMGNVVVLNNDFASRLCPVLVRNQYANNPVMLPVEADPVDAALAIVKSSIGKSKAGTLHVTGFIPKREEGALAGLFKAFK